MPDLRFLTEATFIIGCGVGGLPLLTAADLLGGDEGNVPEWVR